MPPKRESSGASINLPECTALYRRSRRLKGAITVSRGVRILYVLLTTTAKQVTAPPRQCLLQAKAKVARHLPPVSWLQLCSIRYSNIPTTQHRPAAHRINQVCRLQMHITSHTIMTLPSLKLFVSCLLPNKLTNRESRSLTSISKSTVSTPVLYHLRPSHANPYRRSSE